MRRTRGIAIALVGMVLAAAACSEDPASPQGEPEEPEPPLLALLIVSEAVEGVSTPGGGTSYVSLPPGSLPGYESVRIRNATADGSFGESVPLLDAGFDPVAVTAGTGNLLELSFRAAGGGDVRRGGRVPDRQQPVVLRTAPAPEDTDVSAGATPTVVFSEPVDPGTLQGVSLWKGGRQLDGEVVLEDGRSWVARFTPSASLEPGTYALEVTRSVRDLAGDWPEVLTTALFSTTPSVELDTFARTGPAPAAVSERFVLSPSQGLVWLNGTFEYAGTYRWTAEGGIAFFFDIEVSAGPLGGNGTPMDEGCFDVVFNFLANDWGFKDGTFCLTR